MRPHSRTPQGGEAPVASGARVADFTLRRLERALRERTRYRYVRPRVLRDEAGWRIESPCCSRNVDPQGGVIDIARLTRQGPAALWQLHARDHVAGCWVLHAESAQLDELLDVVCIDRERVFWP